MASNRISFLSILAAMVVGLGFTPAHTPAAAQLSGEPVSNSATATQTDRGLPIQSAKIGRQSEVDTEIAVIMQMLRDEGIDIDDRIARARAQCRDKVMSGTDKASAEAASPEEIERSIEKCGLVEENIVYARAINEMNATRADKFDSAMAQYNAEVAEADFQNREFDRKQREYELQMQGHNAEVAEVQRQQQQYERDKAAHDKLLAGLPGGAKSPKSQPKSQPKVQPNADRERAQELASLPAPSPKTVREISAAQPAAQRAQAPVQTVSVRPAPVRSAPVEMAPAQSAPVQTATVDTVALPPQKTTQPRPTPPSNPMASNNADLAANTPSAPSSQVQDTRPAASTPALTRGGPSSGVTRGRMLSPGTGASSQEDIELAIMKASGPRIALVIGNEDYEGSMGSLANPVNDAVLIGATLRSLGFDVEILTDGSQRAMKEAVRRLGDRLASAGDNATGLFYYAGHGVQSGGTNFLIPVGSTVDSESDLELEAVKADAILAQMEEAYVSTRIVILDACRNMPLRRRTRSGARGLARMEIPNGSFVAYSTSPGSTAADGGRNIHSPFAEALATQMLVPDRPIEVTFREVRRQVVEVTSGDQVPWDSSSLLDTFSFAATR